MKEESTLESIQLTRVHAVQWYGFCDSFDLGGQTIITGIYGCGKTGLIDLIQTVLLGHPERENRYNLSLADIGNLSKEEKRDLRGYCLQDLNLRNHGQPVYARNSSRTYLALEFTWPDHQRRETWGLRVEYTSVGADADIAYWKVPARLNFEDFLDETEVPRSAEDWENTLHRHGERVFASKTEYLEAMSAGQHLNFNKCVFKPLLLQTLQFRFGKDFTEFCRNSILPENPIDLEAVRGSYDRYRDLVTKMGLLRDQEVLLEQIQATFAKQKTARDEMAALQCFGRKQAVTGARSTWEAAEAKCVNLRSAAEAWRQRQADLTQRQDNAEKHVAAGHALMRDTPNASDFDALKKRQHALPQEITLLETFLEDPAGAFRAKFERFHALWASGQAALRQYGWAEPTARPAPPGPLPTRLGADELSDHIGELLFALDPLVTHFDGFARTAESELLSLENKVVALRKEIERLKVALTSEELPLHEALRARLDHEDVQLLGNLCTVTDEEWTDALEINFGHKFASVVADAQIKTAFEIFDALPRPRGLERLLCRADMWKLPGTARPGSLAEKVTSPDPAVRQLLAHLFGEVICCRTVDEAEEHPRSILPSGAIKQPTGRRRLRGTPAEYAIGESGRRRMIERKEQEKAALAPEILAADRRAKAARIPAEGFQSIRMGLLQLSTSKVQKFRDLEAKSREQKNISQWLDLFENREQLETLRLDINTRVRVAEEVARAIRDHKAGEPAGSADSERALAVAKEAYERAEAAWSTWRTEHPDELAAADRHPELADEIARKTTPERSAVAVCELLVSRRETEVAETQGRLHLQRLSLRQDPRFTDYRDADVDDFDDNTFFDKKLAYIAETGIKDLMTKAAEAESEWEERFQNQVLGQLQSRFHEIRETFGGLRRLTAGRSIGGTGYDFTYKTVDSKYFQTLRRLASDRETDNLLSAGDTRFAEIKRERRAAMDFLMVPPLRDGADAARVRAATTRVRELLDARYYFTYDMEILEAGRSEKISLSQRGRKGSGGETYNPYFIALTTAYLRAYHRHLHKGRPSISLLIMDEAFKVLNSEAIRDCVQIIRELGLQGVISCTDTNGGQIVESFQWAMIVQKLVTPGVTADSHDRIENTILSAPRNDPDIRSLLADFESHASLQS